MVRNRCIKRIFFPDRKRLEVFLGLDGRRRFLVLDKDEVRL